MKKKSDELGIIGQVEICLLSLVATTAFMAVIAMYLMAGIAT